MCFFAMLICLFQAAQSIPAPGIPGGPGVYFQQDNKWIGIKPAPVSGTKTKGLGTFVDTGGYTDLGTDVVLPGAASSIRISIPKPTFYVRGIGYSKDAMLIRLIRKGKSRVFHTSSGDATVENKEGFRKADIRKTVVTDYPDGTYSITPESDLKPEEYLLVLGDTASTFDFGIDPAK